MKMTGLQTLERAITMLLVHETDLNPKATHQTRIVFNGLNKLNIPPDEIRPSAGSSAFGNRDELEKHFTTILSERTLGGWLFEPSKGKKLDAIECLSTIEMRTSFSDIIANAWVSTEMQPKVDTILPKARLLESGTYRGTNEIRQYLRHPAGGMKEYSIVLMRMNTDGFSDGVFLLKIPSSLFPFQTRMLLDLTSATSHEAFDYVTRDSSSTDLGTDFDKLSTLLREVESGEDGTRSTVIRACEHVTKWISLFFESHSVWSTQNHTDAQKMVRSLDGSYTANGNGDASTMCFYHIQISPSEPNSKGDSMFKVEIRTKTA